MDERLQTVAWRVDEETQPHLDARVLAMREAGASWLEIQRTVGLTRQQVRYAYQRAKREERRRERRGGS